MRMNALQCSLEMGDEFLESCEIHARGQVANMSVRMADIASIDSVVAFANTSVDEIVRGIMLLCGFIEMGDAYIREDAVIQRRRSYASQSSKNMRRATDLAEDAADIRRDLLDRVHALSELVVLCVRNIMRCITSDTICLKRPEVMLVTLRDTRRYVSTVQCVAISY